MFGLSFGEIFIICVVALMVLGPQGMPKLARTLGKAMRDFRRATGDLKGAFEDEFYKLDQAIEGEKPAAPVATAAGGAEPTPDADPATLHKAPEAEAAPAVAASAPATAPAENVVVRAPEGAVARAPEGAIARAPANTVAQPSAEPAAAPATEKQPA